MLFVFLINLSCFAVLFIVSKMLLNTNMLLIEVTDMLIYWCCCFFKIWKIFHASAPFLLQLNSRIQAKNHYEGKQHRKKVKNYLVENARKDGQPPAKIAKIDLSTSKKVCTTSFQ